MIAELAFVIALVALVLVRLDTLMAYFQQEEYATRRFLAAIPRVRLYDLRATGVVAVALVLGLATGLWAVLLLLAAAALAGIAWDEARYKWKKPLVMTDRAWRIQALARLMSLPVLALALVHPLLAVVMLHLLPLQLIAANALLNPYQTRINRRYVAAARAKLERLDPVRIGITGSFGKTTVKHILAELLELSGPVFYSRGSINTELGLTRHIRQRLQPAHRYFVAEMGAYGIGSVRRLCDFVRPRYGIVTAVGAAHMERFGSLEAVAQAKSELVEAVCASGGLAVINAELLAHDPFAKLKAAHPDHVLTVGEGGDVAVAAELQGSDWQITLSGGGLDIAYALPLLGEHNILNSALAVALAARLDPSVIERLPLVTRVVEQVPHRLQKREAPGQPLVLDDAFNSNETGFANALRVLRQVADQRGGRAILVTPGIVELGLEHERVHARLGALAADCCDEIHAVNPGRIASFVQAAKAGGATVHGADTLGSARAALKGAAPEDVILYENDLPDILEERRLL
ncbi:UDP-N-acetylmuramoyl-tripeptide--D-alanyl-D-alanine ligase [Rhodobacteraceae bacterium 2376]|uniref:UDP-N-acetylmuramoyl-tripeptide--D-alanyl-D-alanine ligase n=1 Tax=Rhabdonatronobacter sediminivivens TaxID=2743469 RepID=A0A7Z0KY38_9RHOB|nr:UDP-N-acetylmuramoyl-tripeptide--D-alanyl-D-alanine ligase [Rhabdonatronobacter sediminivivens]NYS24875.1 UDP-N-acetylmuramoyl-tripeptide--D-alanyl-D-alanine ligase [Rhabdonatronobacter sediminivivens]